MAVIARTIPSLMGVAANGSMKVFELDLSPTLFCFDSVLVATCYRSRVFEIMREESEPRFPHPLSGARVDPLPSGLVPARRVLDGRHVRLEPLDSAVHTADLYEASHTTEEGRAIWTYLPEGHMIYKGLNRDTAWYSILGDEWPAVRAILRRWLADDNFDARGIAKNSLSAMMDARTG